MEININCDLGEKSKHYSNKYDSDLLEIVNSANIACGYHAGDKETMNQVIKISKKNGVSIGAHPSFNDPENFGRERMNLTSAEIRKLIIDQYEILFRPPNYIEDRADAPREWGGWHHADDVQDMIKALRGFIEIKCESKETTIGQNFLIIGSRLGHHFKDHQLLVHAPRVLGLRRYVLGLMSEKEARKMVIEEIDDLSLVSEILQEAGLHPGLISHSIDKRKPNQTESYVAWREYEHYVHNLLRPEAEDQDLREKNILRLQALVWLISSQPKQLNSWMPIDEYLKHHQREELDFLSRSSIVAICDEGNAVSIPSGHLSVLVMQWYADYFSDYFRKHYSLHLIAQLALGSPLAISILVVTLMVILLKKPDVLVNLWVAVFGGLLALVLLSWSIGWFFTQKMIE